MSNKNIPEGEENRPPNDQKLETQKEFISDLNTPLIKFCLDGETFKKHERLILKDALRGTQIFGEIGSGKSSGSGRELMNAIRKSGFGGMGLTGKKQS